MKRPSHQLILGVNSAYHESAAALIRGGEVILAIEEERLSRVKHAKAAKVDNPDELPWNAIAACLEAGGGLQLTDLDTIAYSFAPKLRLNMIGVDPYPIPADVGFGTELGELEFNNRIRRIPCQFAERSGQPALAERVRFIPHHLAHAGSVFCTSPFRTSAVLIVDGIGERSTAWLGKGTAAGLEQVDEIPYPHSIGLLWERIAVYLGFTEYDACKVMGLVAYGDPEQFATEMNRLFCIPDRDGGCPGSSQLPFMIDPELARFRSGDVCGLESLFGPRRRPDERPDSPRFAAVAAALQMRTNDAVLALSRRLARATAEQNLCYAGGVALNCITNALIEREGPFDALYLNGAAHDAGSALGAALIVDSERANSNSRMPRDLSLTPYLGTSYSGSAIDDALSRSGLSGHRVMDPAAEAADLLAEGLIVGWFQGRLEFGPRALGNRSLLADPRRADIREKLNQCIKHRESFRPFAASILAESAAEWFDFPSHRSGATASRDLMLLAYPVRSKCADEIPAVLHRDGTCRMQLVDRHRNPIYHALISRFRDLTGIPLVLNTSFNDQEPLVASPTDALATFTQTGINALFLGDRLVRRRP